MNRNSQRQHIFSLHRSTAHSTFALLAVDTVTRIPLLARRLLNFLRFSVDLDCASQASISFCLSLKSVYSRDKFSPVLLLLE